MSEPAVVTQASPLMIRLDSADTATPALHLASYTPVVDDHVSVLRQGGQDLVIGRFL